MPYDRTTARHRVGFNASDIASRLGALSEMEPTLEDIARAIANEYRRPDPQDVQAKLETAFAQSDAVSARNRVRSIKAYVIDMTNAGDTKEAFETIFRAALGTHCLPKPDGVLTAIIESLKNEPQNNRSYLYQTSPSYNSQGRLS